MRCWLKLHRQRFVSVLDNTGLGFVTGICLIFCDKSFMAQSEWHLSGLKLFVFVAMWHSLFNIIKYFISICLLCFCSSWKGIFIVWVWQYTWLSWHITFYMLCKSNFKRKKKIFAHQSTHIKQTDFKQNVIKDWNVKFTKVFSQLSVVRCLLFAFFFLRAWGKTFTSQMRQN